MGRESHHESLFATTPELRQTSPRPARFLARHLRDRDRSIFESLARALVLFGDMDLVTQAKMFATQKHVLDNKQLYGVLPYTHHLAAVEEVLVRYNFLGEQIRAAAWLHDVVEDTRGKPNEVRVRDIKEIFGDFVAELVGAVTCEEGPNRKTRNALTYPKIAAAGEYAVALKLADRIANVEFEGGAIDMYKKEHPEFSRQLKTARIPELSTVHAMWWDLDDLIEGSK